MTIAYYTSEAAGEFTTPVLYGWWSDTNDCFWLKSSNQRTTTAYPAVGTLVQVTVIYDFTQTAPGPAFDVMQSVLGIKVYIVAQYALVVSQ
jgi:hypothetical protein